jgi:hypothetical protein
VDAVNLPRRARTVDLVRELVGDDIRDSPALDVAATLRRRTGTRAREAVDGLPGAPARPE